MKKFLLFLPLFLLFVVMSILVSGLLQDPKQIASALINQPFPSFAKQDLVEVHKQRTQQDLPKQLFLLNVWGSWCVYCRQEHSFLLELSREIPIIGLNYRDQAESGIQMLTDLGNPFVFSLRDPKGELALKLGVDGAPETYLIDAKGIIRYRYSGMLNRKIWQTYFEPEMQRARKE